MLRQMSAEELLACRSKVYRYIYRSVWDWPDRFQIAEDITQQTFVRALENERDFRGDCKVSTWLCIIARNLYKDLLRYKANRKVADHFSLDELTFRDEFEGTKSTRLNSLHRIDSEKQAHDLLRLLDGESRRLMVLSMHGLSHEEISSITHLPTILVKSRIQHIRTKLRRLAATL